MLYLKKTKEGSVGTSFFLPKQTKSKIEYHIRQGKNRKFLRKKQASDCLIFHFSEILTIFKIFA